MALQMTYPKSLTLKQLNLQMRNDEGLAGSVERMGHNDSNTLANFDEGDAPDGELLLDELDGDEDENREGHKFICKGEVWVESKPKLVGAFRAE